MIQFMCSFIILPEEMKLQNSKITYYNSEAICVRIPV